MDPRDSTRPPSKVQLCQDSMPQQSQYHTQPPARPRPQLQPSAMPLKPAQARASRTDVVLHPPVSAAQLPSPLKTTSISSPPRPAYDMNYVPLPPPQQQPYYTDSPMKRPPMQPMRQYAVAPIVHQPLFTTFHSVPSESFDKENYYSLTSNSENFAEFPDPGYDRKPPMKRSLSEMVPPGDKLFRKGRNDESAEIPEPEDMPHIEDDGNKPAFSYAQLIGSAILRGQNRRLTLAKIYQWISDTFAFYRGPEMGWQNSIRHNLSLNKNFMKQERPKGDSGKGNYWMIVPGSEHAFLKEKPTRKANAVLGITGQPQIMRTEPQPLAQIFHGTTQWHTQPVPPQRPQTVPELPELSSDATVPASDPALLEEEPITFDPSIIPGPPPSSPPQAINSSPPMVEVPRRRGGTPSSAQGPQASSSANKKRKATFSMDDSGYFSSLESSAFRPKGSRSLLPSEADLDQSRKKQKTGRAEDDIARIRSSSITPSHHVRFRSLGSDELMSSPLECENGEKVPPKTPNIIFKRPMKPPPSVSPNTNLRYHRKRVSELMNSPLKKVSLFGTDELPSFSPAFKLPDSLPHHAFHDHFEVYIDDAGTNPGTPGFGSPIKRSAKRPALARSTTSVNTMSPVRSLLYYRTPNKLPSLPSLGPTPKFLTPSPTNAFLDDTFLTVPDQENLFTFTTFEDDEETDGVDILKGFAKIGEQSKQLTPLKHKSATTARPGLGRSLTSRF